jgi:integrase/recombinase XerD
MTEITEKMEVSHVFTSLPEAPRADSDSQLLEIWLHGRSRHTQRAYRADVEHFLAWVRKPFLQVTLADLQGFADSLGELAPASRYRTLSAIKSLLAFAHRTGYCPTMSAAPSVCRQSAAASPSAFCRKPICTAILSLEANPRNRAILTLLYASGMRVSELCGLCWRDLQPNSDGGQVTVLGKGSVTRAVKIPASVWKLVNILRHDDAEPGDPVFRSRKGKNGGVMRPLAVLRVVRQAASRAGIELPVSPHWFRRAHASHALDRGAPIHLVQTTLGHASITTTGRYLHARPNDSSSRFLPL